MRTASKLYSETPKEFSHERNDCAVRAVRCACGISYKEAHRKLKTKGRIDGEGTYNHVLTKSEIDTGLRLIPSPAGGKCCLRPTLSQFIRAHPTGRFVIRVNTHFLALINGIVYNWAGSNNGPRTRVIAAWEACAAIERATKG